MPKENPNTSHRKDPALDNQRKGRTNAKQIHLRVGGESQYDTKTNRKDPATIHARGEPKQTHQRGRVSTTLTYLRAATSLAAINGITKSERKHEQSAKQTRWSNEQQQTDAESHSRNISSNERRITNSDLHRDQRFDGIHARNTGREP